MLKLVVNNEIAEDQEAAPRLRDGGLRLLTGGKGPPKSWDWLSSMPAGTVFLARPKTGPNTWIIYEFGHGGTHAGNNTLLIPNRMYDQPSNWFWCDPVEFCKVYELRGILEDE